MIFHLKKRCCSLRSSGQQEPSVTGILTGYPIWCLSIWYLPSTSNQSPFVLLQHTHIVCPLLPLYLSAWFAHSCTPFFLPPF